ncbi:hypothetical protein [Undibacterium sp. Di24W]|uniref:hypothetical protein n=1 Tax=Undibacterium sp. Di24W TaxID=3413033 RepID=UPI003BF2E06B
MSNLTAADALDLIKKNPGDYVTPEQLRALANRVHVEISNLNKVTVLYSGNVAGAINGGGIVSGLVEQKTAVRAISQTELYKFLDNEQFQKAVAQAFSTPSNPVSIDTLNDIAQENHPANKFFNASKTGLWAEGSVRFASSAAGDVRVLAPFSNPSRILAIDELPALLDNTKVTHINGIPKSIFQTILDSNPTTGLTRVNNAVAWSSQALMRNMRLETQPLFNADGSPNIGTNGVQKMKVTGVSAGEFFDGTGIEVNRTPTIGIKLENLIDDTLKKDVLSSEPKLARALEQGRNDIVDAANAAKALPIDDIRYVSKTSWKELGVRGLGLAVGIGMLGHEVKVAIDQGDNVRAEKILANGSVELLVGIAVGDAVVALGLGFISGLAIVNPVTLAIAAGVAIGAGIYVGYQATVAVKNLLAKETGELPIVRIEGDWKLTQYSSGLITKELQTGQQPDGIDFKWSVPDSRGTIVGERNINSDDVTTYLWSGKAAGEGQMLERTNASDVVTRDGEVIREVVKTGSTDANKVSIKTTEHISKVDGSLIDKVVVTSQEGGPSIVDFSNAQRESTTRIDENGVKTDVEWVNKLDSSHGSFHLDKNTGISTEKAFTKNDILTRELIVNPDHSSSELVVNPDSGSRALTKINADKSKEVLSIDAFKSETIQRVDSNNRNYVAAAQSFFRECMSSRVIL